MTPDTHSSATQISRLPWKLAIALVVAAVVAWLFWHVVNIFLLAFAGILGAVLLCTCADLLGKITRCSRRVGVTIVLVLVLSGIVSLVLVIAPALREQVADLQEQLAQAGDRIDAWFDRHSESLPVDDVNELGEELGGGGDLWPRIAGVFSTTLGAVSALVITLVIAVFIAYDTERYLSGVMRLVPLHQRQRVGEVLAATGVTLSRWLLAQLISMLFLALSTWLALWLFGVPLALVLAVVTGIMTFIPYLGPLLAAIPIILVSLAEGPMFAFYVGLTYLVIQNLESNVLMPLVYQKTVRMPPAITLTAQVLFGALVGLPGFILATPLAAAVLVMVRMFYVEDVVGDDLDKPVRELQIFNHPPTPP
jgi:predicted PurR-regulated permease PerM